MATIETPDLSGVRVEDLSRWSESDVGKAYFLDDQQPFLQLYLFPDSYSVLWRSAILNQDYLNLVGDITRSLAEVVLTRSGQPNTLVEFSATMVENGKYFFDTRQFTLKHEDLEAFPAEIGRYYTPRIPDLDGLRIDIMVDGITKDAQFWLDGPQPESSYREMGVSIPSGVDFLYGIATLVQGTSPVLTNVGTPQFVSFLKEILPR